MKERPENFRPIDIEKALTQMSQGDYCIIMQPKSISFRTFINLLLREINVREMRFPQFSYRCTRIPEEYRVVVRCFAKASKERRYEVWYYIQNKKYQCIAREVPFPVARQKKQEAQASGQHKQGVIKIMPIPQPKPLPIK